ncbi:rhamnan synthesis F family protein [Flavicella marina]|uniref:rhamnan synthesis F family protein n=1 Tax=Flavicella marina TaxID=1475951 RepID=UPI00126426BB|nr:rhamnan synthesis F family protein [Flavicella marina]
MKRLTFFSFYDPKNQIDTYVIHYLKELNYVSDIIFSADCELSEFELEKINPFILTSTCKSHGEYDFGSHKLSYLKAIELDILKNYDWLILANDSCYGPFYKLDAVFHKMENKNIDFWGFTHNTIDSSPHIQSYFVSINKDAFKSDTFSNFITSIKKEKIRRNIILKYEHGLTRILEEDNFSYDTYFIEKPNSFLHDPAKDWELMILRGFPFIKRTLFTRNTYNRKNLHKYKKVIHSIHPKYDLAMISDNLKKYKIIVKSHSLLSYISKLIFLPYLLIKIPLWHLKFKNKVISFKEYRKIFFFCLEFDWNKTDIKNYISNLNEIMN